jgi:DNA repair exonuclease SbcCD ATPase subunit
LKQYEKEKVEFQNYINEHPIEWAFFMALKSNKVEEALGIVRQTQVEVQQTNQDIQGTTKEFNECKSSIEKMNKPLSNTEKTLSKVAEEAKDFREAIGNGTLKVNIYGANGSITNLFDDENLVKAIKSLPDEIAAELSEDIKQFNATQELTNVSLDKGLISDEEWAKKTNENQNNLFNSVYKLAENGYVTQGKIVANESYLPTLQQILLKIGNQNKANATTSALRTDFAVRRKTSETYGKTLSTLFEMYLENDAIDKSAFNGIADVESKLKGLLDIQSRIKQSN